MKNDEHVSKTVNWHNQDLNNSHQITTNRNWL